MGGNIKRKCNTIISKKISYSKISCNKLFLHQNFPYCKLSTKIKCRKNIPCQKFLSLCSKNRYRVKLGQRSIKELAVSVDSMYTKANLVLPCRLLSPLLCSLMFQLAKVSQWTLNSALGLGSLVLFLKFKDGHFEGFLCDCVC